MAVISQHLAGSLRLTGGERETIHSYHRIRPTIARPAVESFVQGVGMIRGENVGNAYLTLTTELLETDD